jgi:NTE family protein
MPEKRITLALQGGGSHGAFTWGVLERLLGDGRMVIEGVSGSSAGAINAAVLAHGCATGGREGGIRALDAFWQRMVCATPPGGWTLSADPAASRNHPAIDALMFLSRFLTPGQINPFNLNLLRDILAEQIDFGALRESGRIKLFIAATQVATGKARIFSNGELSLEVLLASACLPSFNQPVEIDGEGYWDGALTANPPLRPLLYHCDAADMLIVAINPRRRHDAPATADEIRQRLTEISFNAAAASELQGIALAKTEAGRGPFALGRLERRLRRLNLHMIDADDFMSRLDITSRLNTDAAFIAALRKEGGERADAWLRDNFRHIGARSSLVLAEHLG